MLLFTAMATALFWTLTGDNLLHLPIFFQLLLASGRIFICERKVYLSRPKVVDTQIKSEICFLVFWSRVETAICQAAATSGNIEHLSSNRLSLVTQSRARWTYYQSIPGGKVEIWFHFGWQPCVSNPKKRKKKEKKQEQCAQLPKSSSPSLRSIL